MPVVAFKSFPLADKNTSWSFSGADGNRLIERGGWSLFKQVHTWFDDSEGSTPENKSAYKLPHHKEIDGEVKTVWRGCTAAMSRLMQQNTQIPDSDRRGCYNHLSRHYREFDEEPPEFGRYSNEEIMEWLLKWGYSREEAEEILKPEPLSRRRFGEPTDTQLEKINQLAKRPLSKEEVFIFPDKLAGDMIIPQRHIQLSKPLLNVFKQYADNGVSLLLDHPWAGIFGRPKPAIAYGRTFDAYMKRSQVEGENWGLFADHYIPRGIEIDGISTDSIIHAIETGTLFDTSIGWGAENYECSICGNDIRDASKCSHWPGQTYENEETGETQLCYAIAKPPGFLMENSLVFDGAYPTAGVLSQVGGEEVKGDWVAVDNLKNAPPNTQLLHIFSATKCKLYTFAKYNSLEKRVYLSVPNLSQNSMKGGADSMGDERVYTQEEVDALIKEAVDKHVAEIVATAEPLQQYMTKEQATEALGQEYTAEEVLHYAKEGITCHNEAVEEAIKEGVRAMGNDFSAETWKKMLESMSIQDIREVAKTWHKQAEDTIPAGRVTVPGSKKGGSALEEIPEEAFKC